MALNAKYVFTVISTNFDLKPVLEEYRNTYPDGELQNFCIVFQTEGEFQPESKTYIIVSELRKSGVATVSFHDFLKSYCTVHDVVAVTNPLNSVFPDISVNRGRGQRPQQERIFGTYTKPSNEND